MSNSIPSDTSPIIFFGSRFTTNRACLPSISYVFARYRSSPPSFVLLCSPKFTMSLTTLVDPIRSSTRSMVPTRTSIFSSTSREMVGLTEATLKVPIIVPRDGSVIPERRESMIQRRLEDLAILHNKGHASQRLYVVQRVTVHRNDVGQLAGLNVS